MHANENAVITSEILADMQRAAQLALSGKRDPDFERRIRQQAERIRDELYHKHGLLDIGVPAIRELRDGADG